MMRQVFLHDEIGLFHNWNDYEQIQYNTRFIEMNTFIMNKFIFSTGTQ